MTVKLKFNTKDFDKIIDQMDDLPVKVMKKLYPFYKKKTPIDQGYARDNTFLNKTTINSKYAYAGRLDDNPGWSSQAPKGFTEPSIAELEKLVNQEIKRI